MLTLAYSPISPTRYITVEKHGLIYKVCDWGCLNGTWHCYLIGGSPKTKNRGYQVYRRAMQCYREFLARLSVPTEYEMAQLQPLLGSLQVTGLAHHPITDIGGDVLFFTLDGKLGFYRCCKKGP